MITGVLLSSLLSIVSILFWVIDTVTLPFRLFSGSPGLMGAVDWPIPVGDGSSY